MFNFISKFLKLYEALEIKAVSFKGHIWREYQRMITPLGPVKLDYSITDDEAKYLLSQFPQALLIRWTDGFDNQSKVKNGMQLY